MWLKAKHKRLGDDGRVPSKLATSILRLQKSVSTFLNKRTAHFGSRGKTAILLVVVLCFGGLSIGAFIGAFSSGKSYDKSLRPVAMSVPRYEQRMYREGPRVSSRDMERILIFKNYLDSLSKDSQGRRLFDSILSQRPRLLDSLNEIISFYYSPLKP